MAKKKLDNRERIIQKRIIFILMALPTAFLSIALIIHILIAEAQIGNTAIMIYSMMMGMTIGNTYILWNFRGQPIKLIYILLFWFGTGVITTFAVPISLFSPNFKAYEIIRSLFFIVNFIQCGIYLIALLKYQKHKLHKLNQKFNQDVDFVDSIFKRLSQKNVDKHVKKKFKDHLIEQGMKNKPLREKVIAEAKKIMENGSRSDYITKNNNASSKLYKATSLKSIYDKPSTIRNWLDDAIKRGEI